MNKTQIKQMNLRNEFNIKKEKERNCVKISFKLCGKFWGFFWQNGQNPPLGAYTLPLIIIALLRKGIFRDGDSSAEVSAEKLASKAGTEGGGLVSCHRQFFIIIKDGRILENHFRPRFWRIRGTDSKRVGGNPPLGVLMTSHNRLYIVISGRSKSGGLWPPCGGGIEARYV